MAVGPEIIRAPTFKAQRRETDVNTISKSIMGGVAAIALITLGSGAYAQAPAPSADAAKSGAMASAKAKMSAEDKATMKKCKAMTADARAADMACKSLMAAHPDVTWDKGATADKPK